MSAQYLLTFNGTDHLDIVAAGQGLGAAGGPESTATDAEASRTKQKEALYYIVAVITFYALTFMVLFCKYARFKKKELDDSIPYFPLPPDPKAAASRVQGDHVALRKYCYGPRDSYGSNGVVSPKVMRVKMLPHRWLCRRREETDACDV